jgi:hypothetical protein
VTPVVPTVVPPTCEADGYVVLPESAPGYRWVLQDDGTYLAVPDTGYVFPAGATTSPADQPQARHLKDTGPVGAEV